MEIHGLDEEGMVPIDIECKSPSSSVHLDGIALYQDLVSWRICLESMYENLTGICKFSIADPEFTVILQCARTGQIEVEITASFDRLSESHWFKFEIDQSYLLPIINCLQRI